MECLKKLDSASAGIGAGGYAALAASGGAGLVRQIRAVCQTNAAPTTARDVALGFTLNPLHVAHKPKLVTLAKLLGGGGGAPRPNGAPPPSSSSSFDATDSPGSLDGNRTAADGGRQRGAARSLVLVLVRTNLVQQAFSGDFKKVYRNAGAASSRDKDCVVNGQVVLSESKCRDAPTTAADGAPATGPADDADPLATIDVEPAALFDAAVRLMDQVCARST